MQQIYTYLALGDSYTIGEAVPLTNNFPHQLVQRLRKKGLPVAAPEIIAQTGWTTDELDSAIKGREYLSKYDMVTLLIGVNNQYRGRDALQYKMEFEELLKKAIEFANGKPSHVCVVSIPDYGVTPFAKSMDVEKIGREIDIFNNINKAVSIQYKTHYVDITPGSREVLSDEELVTTDKLHPSGKEYLKWAEKLENWVTTLLK
jgi:lysophospholipase L1-like esterase